MLLSKEEREKFIKFCEMEARTCAGLAKEMKKLGLQLVLIERELLLAKSYETIATHLGSVDDVPF